eukprot:2673022-Alexandrium_andersonii.AAC.1
MGLTDRFLGKAVHHARPRRLAESCRTLNPAVFCTIPQFPALLAERATAPHPRHCRKVPPAICATGAS